MCSALQTAASLSFLLFLVISTGAVLLAWRFARHLKASDPDLSEQLAPKGRWIDEEDRLLTLIAWGGYAEAGDARARRSGAQARALLALAVLSMLPWLVLALQGVRPSLACIG